MVVRRELNVHRVKRCAKCGEEKPESEFFRQRKSKDGRYSYCKPCNAIAQREKRAGNSELSRKERDYVLKTKYGITENKYSEMLAAQDGKCAICGKGTDYKNRRLAVDHCHETGSVRGLLCGDCNTAIGLFRDNTESLLSAARYLTKAPGRNKCL